MNGSPTCMVGALAMGPPCRGNSSLAIVAPWMPSRPVFAPM